MLEARTGWHSWQRFALLPRPRLRCSSRRRQARSTRSTVLNGAGSTFVSPLVSTWTPAIGSAFDYTVQYSADRLGRRHPGDHQPHRRLRRLRCAADAGSVHRVQRLRPDPVGACRHGDPVQRPRASRCRSSTNLHLSGDVIAKIYMGQITNWNDPAIKALNPEATDARPEDHARLPHRQLRHDLQLHRLPLLGQPDLEVAGRRRASRSRGRPASGRAARPVSPVSSRTPPAQSATWTRPSRSRTSCTSRRSRTAAGKFIYPSIRNVAAAGATITSVPANNELHIVNPPKTAPAGVSDLHLHLHHPPDQVVERDGAPKDGLLGADDGPTGQVHGEAVVLADPQGRARRGREDAQAGPAEHLGFWASPSQTIVLGVRAEGAPRGAPSAFLIGSA